MTLESRRKPVHIPVETQMKCRQHPKPLCRWPRCDCPVDLVYMTDCFIPKPSRGGKR